MSNFFTFPFRIALVTSLAFVLSGSAFAQPTERSPAFPAGLAEARLIKEMPEEIGVDEETLAKLEKLVEEIRAKDKELEGKIMQARNEVMALLDESRPDEKKLMAGVGVSSGFARQTREHRVKASLRIRALLNKEQLAKFMELRAKAVERRSKNAGKRRR